MLFTCAGQIVLALPPQFWERLLENGGGSFTLYPLEVGLLFRAPPAQVWERLLLNGGGSFVLFAREKMLLIAAVVIVIRGLPTSRSSLLCSAV